ncbi:MAG: hypothetical protein J6B09_00165 [Clostridia bacterium]|nr:hypothetical protein [Clostridia bacterium]
MAAKRKKAEKSSAVLELRRLLAERVPEAVAFLVQMMRDEAQKPELRMKAAESILDRACGKASSIQPTESEGGAPISISFEGVLEEWSR